MATIELSNTNINSSRVQGTYFPAIPPKAPKLAISYSKSVSAAPHTALAGVIVDGRQPDRYRYSSRDRVRKMVGQSNRWRLPQSLGSDLLGSSQASRAVSCSMNNSMVHIITAENPRLSVNLDVTRPYQFRADQRPVTTAVDFKPSSRQSTQKVSFDKPVLEKEQTMPALAISSSSPTSRTPRPIDVFQYHSKLNRSATGPDVLLKCLDMNWELHRPMLQKSDVLSDLLEQTPEDTGPKKYYKTKMSETLDDFISKSSFYSNDYQEMSQRLSGTEVVEEDEEERGVDHPKHISQERVVNDMTVISLEVEDSLITRHALAVALGNLYHDEACVETEDLVGVLAAAKILKFHQLENGCTKKMLTSISCANICSYHEVAEKYHQDHLQSACERWLELNLVPQMATHINLRHIPMALLQKVIQSNRLFTTNEFMLFKVVTYWVFLQLNPEVQLMPSYSTVLTYFNSLPKANSLLDREEGQLYSALYKTLRLHGITETNHLEDVQSMNILPQAWVLQVLTQHYQSLQGGGDMLNLTNFHSGCIRQGFIIHEEPHYHSEIFSLHGFHFELKSVKQSQDKAYSFYMQRLKPSDPVLSFRQCERNTFSMRPDREVRYAVRVQYFDASAQVQTFNTGMLSQRFGLGNKTSKSEVVNLESLNAPIYVTFAFLFPVS